MFKRIFGVIAIGIIVISLVACGTDITLSIEDLDIEMIEGGTYQIDFDTNDAKGVNFESKNLSIITVSSSGLVTAVAEGETTVVVSSKDDPEIKVTITVKVSKNYTLTVPSTAVAVKVGESKQVVFTANDTVTLTSANQNVFTVDQSGLITGVAEGKANLTIQSVKEPSLSVTVEIDVRKIVTLEVNTLEESLWIGATKQISLQSNADVTYESSDTLIATVDSAGVVTAVGQGDVKVIIRSSYDLDVFEEVTVKVYNLTQSIMITGDAKLNVGSEKALSISVSPDVSYAFVSWESSNEEVATIDENGLINAIKPGTITITATSLYDDSIKDTFTLEVINYLLVDESKILGDSVTYLGVEFEFGIDLFASINDALDVATNHATVLVYAGTYAENIVMDIHHLTLKSVTAATINGTIEVKGDHTTIDGFSFIQNSRVFSNTGMSSFTFKNNQAVDLTLSGNAFLNIEKATGVTIASNTITNLNTDAIVIEDYLGGTILVEKNTITNVHQAIKVNAVSEYDDITEVIVSRNTINQATVGIEINKKYSGAEKNILAYARFNSVTNSTLYAAKSQTNSTVDFTLNHWGQDEVNPSLFPGIDSYYLRGAYQAKTDIVLEANYNKNLPVTFIITNPISEIILGDNHTFTYEILPMELVTDRVRWITGDPGIMLVNTVSGLLSPQKSGVVTLTLRSTVDININVTITITVTTTPGIELKPSYETNDLIVGDTLTLTASPYPFNISNAEVEFVSSNQLIATINEVGLVTTLAAGEVTFTASLKDDPSVQTSYTMSIYSALDNNNLLDLLTTYQVAYSNERQWLQYGVTFNYTEIRYDSVSKYLFQNIDVNLSKMLPISSGIRPGILKPAHPDGITTYNPQNVYWVVVHETANTSPGAGALSHANYLWNAAQAGTVLNVSWHYTNDARVTYQHVPENEIAYHAGDGSSLPGTSLTYLGGGNRNGIGIEMSVAQDEDMYLTFQRTAKLSADILFRYNLPRSHIKFHQDFSGKWCPQGMLRGGMVPTFQAMADAEFAVRHAQGDRTILFESNNPEYVDQTGRVIQMPDRPMTVSYTITVTDGGISTSRTFFTYLPGTVH
ncbi:MAG: Ig-like domain-containing protein [Acholeplasmataceae bacterium]|nr:Ig-like domain-containing protein [Acholeplasmataceae bacterium]